MNNTEDAPGGDLSRPTRCLTPLLDDLEPGTTEAIRHIAAATQKPVDLPRLPTMQMRQPDGSFKTVPMPATWHSPRRRHHQGSGDAQTVDHDQYHSQQLSLLHRVLGLFGR